ncbi:hypothetical protein CCZ01_01995 [Helicobacter monodelphidis]|uniref:hypothetical protein n=1 Tax=Helicobacter sp. 15-1451 TaxID=2004995 RepID=UPI000DCD2496|nr:hypothetical protein [Helicobacter sp. 15-1451]RAX58579.1 hypothetical protein CCZ01_01995 [Helicobacter sp. 15-1451]
MYRFLFIFICCVDLYAEMARLPEWLEPPLSTRSCDENQVCDATLYLINKPLLETYAVFAQAASEPKMGIQPPLYQLVERLNPLESFVDTRYPVSVYYLWRSLHKLEVQILWSSGIESFYFEEIEGSTKLYHFVKPYQR